IPAQRMLEAEGFAWEGYVDIFDAGPTLTVRAGDLRTARDSVSATVQTAAEGEELTPHLVATGNLTDFQVQRLDATIPNGAALFAADARGGLKDGDTARLIGA